jgi:hypothetical protein
VQLVPNFFSKKKREQRSPPREKQREKRIALCCPVSSPSLRHLFRAMDSSRRFAPPISKKQSAEAAKLIENSGVEMQKTRQTR